MRSRKQETGQFDAVHAPQRIAKKGQWRCGEAKEERQRHTDWVVSMVDAGRFCAKGSAGPWSVGSRAKRVSEGKRSETQGMKSPTSDGANLNFCCF